MPIDANAPADPGIKVVIAEYSVIRTIIWIAISAAALTVFALDPHWDRSPVLRILIGTGGCLAVLGMFTLLLRATFTDGVAVYIQNGQIFVAWAYGFQSIHFEDIAAVSTTPFPAIARITRKTGMPIYLPVGFVKQTRRELVARLNERLGEVSP